MTYGLTKRLYDHLRFALILMSHVFVGGGHLCAQTPSDHIQYQADLLQGRKAKGEAYRVLIGHVKLAHQGRVVTCDSAFFFHTREYVEAHGHVRMQDSVGVLTAERMHYDGLRQKATFYHHVTYQTPEYRFETDTLWYDGLEKYLYYRSGGYLKEDAQTLRSRIGRYDYATKKAYFYDSVLWIQKEYHMRCDTLFYSPKTTIAQMPSLTTLWDTEANLYMVAEQGGVTQSKPTQWALFYGTELVRDSIYVLQSDTLYRLPDKGQNYVKGHVALFRLDQSLRLYGQRGYYDERMGFGQLYERAGGQRATAHDTLYMRCDTLEIHELSDHTQLVKALHGVRMASTTWSARADSMDYHSQSQQANLYGNPLVWVGDAQIIADSTRAYFNEQSLTRLQFRRRCLMAEPAPATTQYNQIKGRQFDMYFERDSLRRMHVSGNGQSLYFSVEQDSIPHQYALNKTTCGAMTLYFQKGKLASIQFVGEPQGTYYPPNTLQNEPTKLAGFQWHIQQKPRKKTIQAEIVPNLHAPLGLKSKNLK